MTFLWYDLETFGRHSQIDRIAQFAALRTDEKLEAVSEPIMLYNKLTPDYIPDPMACLITGIGPSEANKKGSNEYEFIRKIRDEFMEPATTVVGYNTIRFDDEFIRNALYRNFFDPYEREYKRGNSRWDLFPMVLAARDLRPDGIEWPLKADGTSSARLEDLTKANGLEHGNAHDALSDVYATIALARLLKEKQPKLFNHYLKVRKKDEVKRIANIHIKEAFLWTSTFFHSKGVCTRIMVPITAEPGNNNAIVCFDASHDPEELFSLSAEEIRSRIFSTGKDHFPLYSLHINRSPAVAPLKVLSYERAEALGLSISLAEARAKQILRRPELVQKILEVYTFGEMTDDKDPDMQIYSGGFFSDRDKKEFEQVHNTPAAELPDLKLRTEDPRVPEMLWRFTARNFPETLNAAEKERWKSFCASRLLMPPPGTILNFKFAKRKVQEHLNSKDIPADKKPVLQDLAAWIQALEKNVLGSKSR
jgi:exodeoxyribonuclease-1